MPHFVSTSFSIIQPEFFMRMHVARYLTLALLIAPLGALAQSFPTDDPIMGRQTE